MVTDNTNSIHNISFKWQKSNKQKKVKPQILFNPKGFS